MNNVLKTLLLLMCVLFSRANAIIQLSANVPTPQDSVGSVPSDSSSVAIRNMLKNATLSDYYKALREKLDEIASEDKIEWKERDWADCLWLCYYATASPLYVVEYKETSIVSNNFTGDYDVRDRASRIMNLCLFCLNDDVEEETAKLNKTKVRELCVIYIVRIMKDMKVQYVPNLWEKHRVLLDAYIQSKGEEIKREGEEQIEDGEGFASSGPSYWYAYEMLLMYINRRNDKAKYERDFMEPDFMNFLIAAYPENTTAVKRAIKEAGYTEEEVDDLIDRTVGRTAETEYLYKGRKEDKPTKKSKDHS